MYTMFTLEEIKLAKHLKSVTSHDDVILTHTGIYNWVHALAARQVYKTHNFWLWTYGLDFTAMDEQSSDMLNGDMEKIKKNNISYIVVNVDYEKNKINYLFLSSLKLIIKTKHYEIYATGI